MRAAFAATTPFTASSSTTQRVGSTPSSRAARRKTAGWGLPCSSSTAEHTAAKRPASENRSRTASITGGAEPEARASGTPADSSRSSASSAPGSSAPSSSIAATTRATICAANSASEGPAKPRRERKKATASSTRSPRVCPRPTSGRTSIPARSKTSSSARPVAAPRASALAAQEPLELRGDLVAGGQATPEVEAGILDGVELRLELADHRGVLLGLGDELVHLAAACVGGLGELARRQVEAGDRREPLDEGERRRCVRHAGDVVRDARPQADRGDPGARALLADDVRDPCRHVERPGDEADPVRERGVRGRRGEPDRPGVRHGRREGAEADDEADVELDRELADLGGERLPPEVGLRAHEEEQAGPSPVAAGAQLRLGPADRPAHPVVDAKAGPTGPLVDEVGEVERGELLRLQGLEERRHGARRGEAGVDPALERDHEDRARRDRDRTAQGAAHGSEASAGTPRPRSGLG